MSVGVTGSGGTPSGGVALNTTASPSVNKGVGDITLQNGAASSTMNSLPGGQYQVTAKYGGDDIFASSSSNAVAVNVNAEASTLSLFGSYYLYTNNTTGALADGGSYPFGTSIAVEAQAVGVNAPAGSTDGIATGTVTFTDTASTGTVSSGPQNMGTASTAAWVPTAFSAGSHSISASYSGDASFNATSSAAPLNFTVTKADSNPSLWASALAITPGQSVTLQLIVGTGFGTPPTGTATFYSGNMVLGTATVAQTNITWPWISSAATLNVTNLPVGTDSITAQYSGDANYQAGTSSPVQVTVAVPQGLVATLTATPNGISMLPTKDLIVTANVTGVSGKPTPTGSILFYASGPGATWTGASCTLVNGSCSFDFSGSTWWPGTVTVNVSYSGDTTYAASGTVISVTMLNVFTMTAATSVSFAAGATTGNSSALTVTPLNGFTGPIYFACVIAYYPPGAQNLPTCSVPNQVNITGTTAVTASMTISSMGPTTVSRAEGIEGPRWLAAQFLTFFAGIFVIGLPLRRRVRPRGTALFLLIVLVGSMAWVSCGGGSGGGGKTIPGTTAGTYKFMVDGAYTPNVGRTEPFFFSTPQVFVVNVTIQ